MSANDNAQHAFKIEAEILCSFCQKRILLGYTSNGTPEGEPCAMHEKPACKDFLDKELLEFLSENRKRLGIPDPD